MKELIEQIEKLKAITGKDVYLLSCGKTFLSDVEECYGYRVVHLPNSNIYPEQNNMVYIVPMEPEPIITYKFDDYELVENEITKELKAVTKWYATKEKVEYIKEHLEERNNV